MLTQLSSFQPPVTSTLPLGRTVIVPPSLAVAILPEAVKVPGVGGTFLFAEQLALEPPPRPLQFQYHGPVPVTVPILPKEQRLMLGAVVKEPPLADPQTPLVEPTPCMAQVKPGIIANIPRTTIKILVSLEFFLFIFHSF